MTDEWICLIIILVVVMFLSLVSLILISYLFNHTNYDKSLYNKKRELQDLNNSIEFYKDRLKFLSNLEGVLHDEKK